jgi:D-alanyl-D-alanine carboxypeptidase (penicillin-binding protein 5/6)
VCVAVVATLALIAAGVSIAGPPLSVTARAYIVVSGVDGATLAGRATSAQVAIASITKLMTVLVALEHLRLDDEVVVPAAAARVGGATIELRAGERITVRELVEGALIPSANDAATALALAAAGGSETRFVGWMNDEASRLGLTGTHFVTPHGLDVPGHYSTAADVVRLLQAALADPVIRRYASLARATISGGRTLVTTDDLLSRYPPLVAGKTGHTDDAGWSEVAAARSGRVRVYAAVLGAPSRELRNVDLQALLAWGLGQYRLVRVIDKRRAYARVETAYGRRPVAVVALHGAVRIQRVGRPLLERVTVASRVSLPVRRGQRLGEVSVYDRRRLVARSPLVAAGSMTRPGLLGRTGWYATRTLHHLGSIFT